MLPGIHHHIHAYTVYGTSILLYDSTARVKWPRRRHSTLARPIRVFKRKSASCFGRAFGKGPKTWKNQAYRESVWNQKAEEKQWWETEWVLRYVWSLVPAAPMTLLNPHSPSLVVQIVLGFHEIIIIIPFWPKASLISIAYAQRDLINLIKHM